MSTVNSPMNRKAPCVTLNEANEDPFPRYRIATYFISAHNAYPYRFFFSSSSTIHWKPWRLRFRRSLPFT